MPLMVSVRVPSVAVAPAVSVKVLLTLAGFGLNAAVTPNGWPETDKVTLLPKPFKLLIGIVVVP
jgi:hypothetical protein